MADSAPGTRVHVRNLVVSLGVGVLSSLLATALSSEVKSMSEHGFFARFWQHTVVEVWYLWVGLAACLLCLWWLTARDRAAARAREAAEREAQAAALEATVCEFMDTLRIHVLELEGIKEVAPGRRLPPTFDWAGRRAHHRQLLEQPPPPP